MKTKWIMRLMSMALIAIASLGAFSCSSDDDYKQESLSLDVPKNVRGTATAGKITVTWDAVNGATSYKVFRSADGNSFSPIGTLSTNSFTDNAPLSGSNYYCVQALGANDAQSGLSATISCSSDDDYKQESLSLEAPKNVRWTATAGKITVTWDAVNGATSYKVFRSADGNSFSPIGTSSTNSFTDDSPLSGSNYYRVQALGANDAQSELSATTQPITDHEWVDLGLSVKWATCNIGASSPSDYGDYYAWGETTPKATYDSSNCKTYGKSFGDISGNPEYDAARANWGGSWRLPTETECCELRDRCTWTWTSQGGHNGYKVTGPNGNSIFLPAAGYRNGSSLNDAGTLGDYWSSTPLESNPHYAYGLSFGSSDHSVVWNDRLDGLSVRPVSE